MELLAKLLDYFLPSNKRNINQSEGCRLCSRARQVRGERSIWKIWSHKQCRLQRDGNDSHGCSPLCISRGAWMTACMLHKCQKASSNLSRLTKKFVLTLWWARRGDNFFSPLRIYSAGKAQEMEVTICHEALVKMLPIQPGLIWSLAPLIPLCTAAF